MPITALFSSIELAALCLGGVVLFHRSGRPICHSICCGLCVAMMFLSFVFQAAFLVGMPNLSFPLEMGALGFAGMILAKHRQLLKDMWQAVRCFISAQRPLALFLLVAWSYLALQAILLPPGNDDSMAYNLARVLLFQREHTLFLDKITTVRQVIFPVGADILTHLFLRFGTDYGVAVFSFLSYLAIITGTYALARHYAEPKVALTAAIVIASLPELVYQATSTKNDIVAAAVGAFALLIAQELWQTPNFSAAILLILALSFGISTKTTFPALAIPFFVAFTLGLLRKHGLQPLKQIITSNYRRHAPFALAPVLVFSQAWLFAYNKLLWHAWAGPSETQSITRQLDGVSGGIANIVRYFLQTFDLMSPVDSVFLVAKGFRLSEVGDRLYMSIVHPIFGDLGIATCCGTFRIRWECHEDFAWFGPFGFFLIIPAITYASFKTRGFLRVVAISLQGFLVIVSFTLGWTPFNNRYFSLLFALSGALVAFLLQRLKLRHLSVRLITVASVLILFYSAVYNTQKPLLTTHWIWRLPADLAENSIWARTSWGRDRLYYARQYYQDDRLISFKQLVPAGATVAMVVKDPKMSGPWVYQYLLMNPGVKFIPTTPSQLEVEVRQIDYSLLLDSALRDSFAGKGEVVWSPEKTSILGFDGTLLRVHARR